MGFTIRMLLLTALELGLGIFCLANRKLPDGYRFIGKLLIIMAVVCVVGTAVIIFAMP